MGNAALARTKYKQRGKDMAYTETSKQGWFSRIKESIGGIFIGLLMVVVAFPLLFWNEGRAVKRAQDLEFGAGSVVSVASVPVVAGNEGKLVHVHGPARPEGKLTDATFEVSAEAIKLERNVEMFQWKENQKKTKDKNVGGSETTTTEYTYETVWSSTLINSSKFKQANAHKNPSTMPYQSESYKAAKVSLGDFALGSALIDIIPVTKPLPIETAKLPERAKINQGQIYIGKDPAVPDVGDVRVSFKIAPAGDISVVAGQKANRLEVFTHEELNNPIVLLEVGQKSAEELFEAAKQANVIILWVLRVVGFLLMFIGFKLITRPISVLADVIPPLGSAIGCASGFVAFFAAGALSLITIAIGWIFYRPLLAIALFAIGAAMIGGAIFFFIKYKKKAAATA